MKKEKYKDNNRLPVYSGTFLKVERNIMQTRINKIL